MIIIFIYVFILIRFWSLWYYCCCWLLVCRSSNVLYIATRNRWYLYCLFSMLFLLHVTKSLSGLILCKGKPHFSFFPFRSAFCLFVMPSSNLWIRYCFTSSSNFFLTLNSGNAQPAGRLWKFTLSTFSIDSNASFYCGMFGA